MKNKSKTPANKATLHDVAAAAGVSVATASKALNDVPVSAANKAKVLRAAERLGYVVNETARALRGSRSHTIGLVFAELSMNRSIGLVDAMSHALEEAGYSLICATARGDAATYDRLMRRFLERRVDGLFCVTPPEQLPSAERFKSAHIPIATITERSKALHDQVFLRPSIESAAAAALEDLVRLGHRRVYSLDDGSKRYSLATLDPGWRKKIEIELAHLQDIGTLDRLVKDLLARRNPPTVVSAFQAQAEALLSVCNAANIEVPGRLSIISLTQLGNESRASALGLSSLLFRPEVLGVEAARQMLNLLNGKKVADIVPVEVGTWTRRGTVGPAPRHD